MHVTTDLATSPQRSTAPATEICDLHCERRKHQRKTFRAQAYFVSDHDYYQGVIVNISPGGFFVETDHPFKRGREVNLTIAGTRYQRKAMIRARIVRADPSGIGLQIIGLMKLGNIQVHIIVNTP